MRQHAFPDFGTNPQRIVIWATSDIHIHAV